MENTYQMGQYAELGTGDIISFLSAVGVTLAIILISLLLGTILGTILGIIRCSKNKIISAAPLLIMEPLRNSPLVVQLFLVYFGLPVAAHIVLNPFSAAILTLSLNTAAFFAVLVHNSIKAIPVTQWEAGYALGHSKLSTFVHIIGMQALRLLLPQAITLYVGQLQATSLISLIGLRDITRTGLLISTRVMQPFLVWGIVFLVYYSVSFPLSKLAVRLEKRLNYTY